MEKKHFDLTKLVQDKKLTDTELTVLEYIVEHKEDALKLGVRGIAKENFTSTSTIMRLSKKMGYQGFLDMYYHISPLFTTPEEEYKNSVGFVQHFTEMNLLNSQNYQTVRQAAQVLHEARRAIFIYGMGFSSIMSEYLAKKLLVMGVPTISTSAADSIGTFENNLELTEILIVFSRSGKSEHVLSRVHTAKENEIKVIAFTNDMEGTLKEDVDYLIAVSDDRPLDDRNMQPTLFFSRTLAMIELLIYEYYRLGVSNS
ncbi:MAG: MurR/RpiR family transcriptional regulator [Lachnospiraceae bacterium]|nr:MurR/RpiR family transcriptional regulator [Lachnospiraceae bacterium]